jgi:hypothetical protein
MPREKKFYIIDTSLRCVLPSHRGSRQQHCVQDPAAQRHQAAEQDQRDHHVRTGANVIKLSSSVIYEGP